MSNHKTGHDAERKAADRLKQQGFRLIDVNWKTRYCEIDLVMNKSDCIYLIEVKFRKSDTWGSGADYITAAKLRQMHFAAEMWVSANDWKGDYSLAVVSMGPSSFEFIDNL